MSYRFSRDGSLESNWNRHGEGYASALAKALKGQRTCCRWSSYHSLSFDVSSFRIRFRTVDVRTSEWLKSRILARQGLGEHKFQNKFRNRINSREILDRGGILNFELNFRQMVCVIPGRDFLEV